jgi:hypothetical protein
MRNHKNMTEVELEEIESRKAVRRFRNAYITGVAVRKTVKWGLIAIGAATVIGLVTSDKDQVESKDEN